MSRIAFCANNRAHAEFRAEAHVLQEWIVDRSGSKIDVSDPDVDVVSFPDELEAYWTCRICDGPVRWRDPADDNLDAMAIASERGDGG